jgi:hypothetical protein
MFMNGVVVKLITSPDYFTPYPHSRFLTPPSPSSQEPRLPFITITLDLSIINAPSFNCLLTKTDYYLTSHLHGITTSLKTVKLIIKNTLTTPLPFIININK